jgi:hypothetical protein
MLIKVTQFGYHYRDTTLVAGGTCGDRTHLVLIKSQVPLRFGIGSELGTGVEDRTPLIFFVGEAPSPDDNPGMVLHPGVDPGSRP